MKINITDKGDYRQTIDELIEVIESQQKQIDTLWELCGPSEMPSDEAIERTENGSLGGVGTTQHLEAGEHI
jgi:hypothetical protein